MAGEPKSNGKEDKKMAGKSSTFFDLVGFELADLSSWGSFQRLLHRPTDPANLAVLRILFGLVMIMDVIQERGMSHADSRWGDEGECRFPLFNFLAPLPLEWMYILYFIMWLGAIGIMLGFKFRLSCAMFASIYWYIFFLDKTVWNNHSYLYGLVSLLLLCTDSNRYWSVDGLLQPHKRNAHIPLWNYTLFRLQFFLVYFIAGLKKLDGEWVNGHSMNNLSRHWVFAPFTYFVSTETVDLWIVHRCGLLIDLFMGYVLFFDKTRIFGFIFAGSFHLMNSQLFSIGMFPWTMLATMPIFSHVNWPRRLFSKVPQSLSYFVPLTEAPQPSTHCLYTKEQVKPDEKSKSTETEKPPSAKNMRSQPSRYHRVACVYVMAYISFQLFMPYSHFVTKGYNNWTDGLYGYSWDMMIHSWSTQHMRLKYVDVDTGNTGFLNPEAWTRSRRWSSHADMLKQYANCVADRLTEYNITNVELYFDIWRSLNDRFQQRMFDPNVDIVKADWHPFKYTGWIKPLLVDLSDWRERLDEIEKDIYEKSNITDVTFFADFPGLTLENYIQGELNDTKLTVLKGTVELELVSSNKTIVLNEGDVQQIPPAQFHNVRTISSYPSCIMYVFHNGTEEKLQEDLKVYEQDLKEFEKKKNESGSTVTDADHPEVKNPEVAKVWKQMTDKVNQVEYNANMTTLARAEKFITSKYRLVARGFAMLWVSVQTIITRESFDVVFNRTLAKHDSDLFDTFK